MHWIASLEKDRVAGTLEKRLWDAADQFRANSGLKSQEYSAPVLGLIFLRFAEVRFAAQRLRLEGTAASSRRGSRVDDPAAYNAEGVLYLTPNARYDQLLALPEATDVGKAVNDAIRDIEKHNPQLAGVLPKTYNLFTSTLLKELLKKVSEIPATVDYDAFGRIYEYFLGEFARTEGQKGGEFYTPSCIVRLLTEVIEPYHGRILDPACGSGGMFVQSARFVEMHDKVRKRWQEEREHVKKELGRFDLAADRKDGLLKRLDVLKTTDMALIVSPSQNEIEQMRAHGLDIVPHRKRMNTEALDEKFKDPEDPLRLVFLCAMWLTGFDAPSCSTVYLDRPMRNHTLMQTIARANRVFPGKHSGVIVDYANVFASLEKALAIYGAGKGGKTPVRDKKELVEELRKAMNAATSFCQRNGVILSAIELLPVLGMERLERINDAVDALISPDSLRREFLGHQRLVNTLYNAVKPDPAALEFASRFTCLSTIAEAIRAKLNPNPVDISSVMGQVESLLDESITGVTITAEGPPPLDLSKIDFELLAKRYKMSKHKNTDLEMLKAAIRAQLERLIRLNKTRTDFLQKFEELIESYNTGSRNIEELFEELLKLSRSLSEEQQRHVRENMSEEELVIFDILTRPAPELSPEERAEVKKVARELLAKIKELIVINWRQKSMARSQLKLSIEDVLDKGLPRVYSPEVYKQKCAVVFQHFYENYSDKDASAYAAAS